MGRPLGGRRRYPVLARVSGDCRAPSRRPGERGREPSQVVELRHGLLLPAVALSMAPAEVSRSGEAVSLPEAGRAAAGVGHCAADTNSLSPTCVSSGVAASLREACHDPRGRDGAMLARRALLCLWLVALPAFTLAACGASSAGTTHPSGIDGIVLLDGGPGIATPTPLPAGFPAHLEGRLYPYGVVQVRAASGPQARPRSPVAGSTHTPSSPSTCRRAGICCASWNREPAPSRTTKVTVNAHRRTRAVIYVEGM